MTKTIAILGTVALLILLTGLGYTLLMKQPNVGKIDYSYFEMSSAHRLDGTLMLTYTYTGPTELKNVSFYPYIIQNDRTPGWIPDPLLQEYETWKPGESKSVTTDKRFIQSDPPGHVKLALKAEFEGQIVYVTKKYQMDGTPF